MDHKVNQTEDVDKVNHMSAEHKAGFVNIIGNPNVGKSTLMNALVGEKISIITARSQTTRHRILGILNDENYQIVFSDTPGMIKPTYKLQESMVKSARSALVDADILIYVTDVVEKPGKNDEFLDKVRQMKVPVLLIINKIDLIDQPRLEALVTTWLEIIPKAEIIPASALHRFNLDYIFRRILEMLPESPPYFGKDELTDRPERFFVTEIIRGQILRYYKQEIPYAVEPVVEEFKDSPTLLRIRVIIYVERDSQKAILIGHLGKSLKRIGTESRKEMEEFFNQKIFLELFVKVNPDWRNRPETLKQFGY